MVMGQDVVWHELRESGQAVVSERHSDESGKDLDVIAVVDFEIHNGSIIAVTVYLADGLR